MTLGDNARYFCPVILSTYYVILPKPHIKPFTTFNAYSDNWITRFVSRTVGVTSIETFYSKSSRRTCCQKKYSIWCKPSYQHSVQCCMILWLYELNKMKTTALNFDKIITYHQQRLQRPKKKKYKLSLQWIPLYPCEHPFKQLPLMWLQRSSAKQWPHFFLQSTPKWLFLHSKERQHKTDNAINRPYFLFSE